MSPPNAPRSASPKSRRDSLARTGAALACVLASASGCGSSAYVPAASTSTAQAAGAFSIPPKVDIVIAQDDTGSTYEIENGLQSGLSAFVSTLDSQGWNYHLATVPLTHDNTLSQIVASKYDGNWQTTGQWIAPYPGASPTFQMVNPTYFTTPANYSGFFPPEPTNATDWGLSNILFQFNTRLPGTTLLRADALWAIFVVTNGEDSSHVNYCPREGDNIQVPCSDQATNPATGQDYPDATSMSQTIQSPGGTSLPYDSQAYTLSYYETQLQALKASPGMIRMYAAVGDGSSQCLGGGSFFGSRYYNAAFALGGNSYDICNTQLSAALTDMSNDLQTIRMQYQTMYLFIAQAPNVSTITVTEYPSGTGSPITIPESATNGWTYAGYLSNVYAIQSPVQMDLSSGYAIKLNGTAQLVGTDTANVSYTPAGLQPSN